MRCFAVLLATITLAAGEVPRPPLVASPPAVAPAAPPAIAPPPTVTPPPTAVAPPPPAVAPQGAAPARPVFGVTLVRPDTFDGGPGLEVTQVIPGSTAERLGLRVGDRLLAAGGKALSSNADFAAVVQGWKPGQRVELSVRRGDETLPLAGEYSELPRPRELGARADALQREVAELKRAGEAPEQRRLEELLTLLKQVEKDLPAMAAEFKRTYPKGRFAISIHIDITSDDTAPAPAAVQPAPAP